MNRRQKRDAYKSYCRKVAVATRRKCEKRYTKR